MPDEDDAPKRLDTLVDALIARDALPQFYKDRVAQIVADGKTRVHLAIYADKYAVESPDIDCASRIPLCGARCCSMDVLLSPQDIREGGVPWVLERPYELPRDPVTRRCACMDDGGACTIYDKRPATCRSYDCREDQRVWIDFEARIPAPDPRSR